MARSGRSIQLSSKSNLTPADLADIQSSYPLPEGYLYRLPREHETSFIRVTSGIPIFKASLECGFRFPISPFGVALLQYFRLAPGQIHPNGWSQIVAFDVFCRLREVRPSLDLFRAFFRIRQPNTSSVCTFQKPYCPNFNNRLFTSLPNKIPNFETQWLVVETPASIDLPFPFRLGLLVRPELPSLQDLFSQYFNQITSLTVDDPIDLEELLTPQQLQLAGWGTGAGVEVVQEPVRPPSVHDSSVGQNPSSDHEIPASANDPSGFGSVFVTPDAVLEANIAPLHDLLDGPSGNRLFADAYLFFPCFIDVMFLFFSCRYEQNQESC